MSDLPLHPASSGALPAAALTTPLQYRLSTRIVTLSGVALALVLSMIAGTLWLSWQLEGAGAAINDAGSLRMRAGNVAIQLNEARAGRKADVSSQTALLDLTLAHLKGGDPARPLFLPATPAIHAQLDAVSQTWYGSLKQAVTHDSSSSTDTPSLYLARLPAFVAEADALVRMIERENARKTAWLRRWQMALAALACVGTIAIVYLLYAWFVMPVRRLERGLSRIEQREFSARLPVESRDEFGHLAHGFNRMASELQSLYGDLALRVTNKTAQLATRNGEPVALYEMTAFLHGAFDVEVLCRGFLARVMRQFNADAGTVRVLAQDGDNLHVVVSEGLPEPLLSAERCMPASTCVCGAAATSGLAVVRDLRTPQALDTGPATRCGKAGFNAVAAFGIVSHDVTLGSFSLHFRDGRAVLPSETRLLDTLGKHLGTALQNHRLATAARQLAVAQERHLVAQGLHDSIAQSLNFLKLQLHLLDDAASRNDMNEVREIAPLLRGGLEESYEDVRELLVNFRTKFATGNLRDAVDETVTRFERQTEALVRLDYDEAGGLPLPPDQQLQVLFILQEALSSVRKHASATQVHIAIRNAVDFDLTIEDDGDGYDPAEIASRGDAHIGFHIMRERAARLGAQLRLDSEPGNGARVRLLLPGSERQAMTIRILLIDDHTLFRSGVRALLQRQSDFEVVDDAADGIEGFKRAKQHRPDVVLLDLNMPGLSGIETLQLLQQDLPDTAVIMLTVSEDVDELTCALREGACGYLLKNMEADALATMIRRAAEGESVIAESKTQRLIAQMRTPVRAEATPAPPPSGPREAPALTPREHDIVRILSRGASNKDIARELDLAESMVKIHVRNALRKLNLSSRVQIAIHAISRDLNG